MTSTNPSAKLPELVRRPAETEWVEFKHNNGNPQEVGEYISAISNAAALHGKPTGYIVWGVEDGTHALAGMSFRPRQAKKRRIGCYLIPPFDKAPLGTLTRPGLQDFLDGVAAKGLSYSIVAHVRWDLRQILRLAKSDAYIQRNPAEELFVPKDAPRPESTVMTREEVIRCIACLDHREALIAKLALLGGFRPGEIFA